MFAVFFSVLIEDTAFNSNFYKEAFERLGTYGRIAALAEIPIEKLSSKIAAPSIEQAGEDQTAGMLKAFLKSNISEDMIRENIDSLADGLTAYFKGEAASLPDLRLTGDDSLKNINLQALFMYLGESRTANILSLICLFQYAVSHIPAVALILFPFLFICLYGISTDEIQIWLESTAFYYGLACTAASLAIQPLLHLLSEMPLLKADSWMPPGSLILMHVVYFTDSVKHSLLISSALLASGAAAGRIFLKYAARMPGINTHICRLNVPSVHVANHTSLNVKGHPVSGLIRFLSGCRKTILLPVAALLLGLMFFTVFQHSADDFYKRNLEQPFLLLWENNPVYRAVDARDDLVYLLEIHMTDSAKKAAPGIRISIKASGITDSTSKTIAAVTDKNGIAVFILNKGTYTLVLNSVDTTPDRPGIRGTFQFELRTPGKSVLYAELADNPGSTISLKNASLQYSP